MAAQQQETRRDTRQHAERGARRTVVTAGRVGMVAYGVVHLLIGWLAIQVAVNGGPKDTQKADQRGAVEMVAAKPFGPVLLIALALGLVAFGLWQLYAAVRGYRWVFDNGKRTRKRIAAAIRGAFAIFVAAYAVRLLVGAGQQDANKTQQTWTGKLLSLPAGRILLAAVALLVIGVGISRIRTGVKKKFMENLDTFRLPSRARALIPRLGQVGYPAKGVAIGIVGVLLGLAAWHANPQEAGGLDRALRTLAGQPFGPFLLIVVALGLVAYGGYCFASARAERT